MSTPRGTRSRPSTSASDAADPPAASMPSSEEADRPDARAQTAEAPAVSAGVRHDMTLAAVVGALERYRDDYTIATRLALDLQATRVTPSICVFDRVDLDAVDMDALADSLPRLAVEVQRPDEDAEALARRVRLLLQAGVPACWVVRPEEEAFYVAERTGDGGAALQRVTGTATDPNTGIQVQAEGVFVVPEGERSL